MKYAQLLLKLMDWSMPLVTFGLFFFLTFYRGWGLSIWTALLIGACIGGIWGFMLFVAKRYIRKRAQARDVLQP